MTMGDNKGEQEEISSDPGADGFAVVIQNEGLDALGQYGRGIGYDGIKRSVAVEFDTYHNPTVNDPNGNHIGIQSMGRLENSSRHAPPANLAFTSAIPRMMADGSTYHAFIEYEAKRLRVYFNTEPSFQRPVLVRDVDLDSLIGLDEEGRAWVGITSATGRSVEQHEIVRWEMNGCAARATVSVDAEPQDYVESAVPFVIRGSRLARYVDGPVTIAVYDLQGRLMWSGITNDANLDLCGYVYDNGCYVVHIMSHEASAAIPWLYLR
jgi:hypothetical protein